MGILPDVSQEDEGKISKYHLEWGELRNSKSETHWVFFFNIITGIKHSLLLQSFLEFLKFF